MVGLCGEELKIMRFIDEWCVGNILSDTTVLVADTVDGRNPAPPGMYKTL